MKRKYGFVAVMLAVILLAGMSLTMLYTKGNDKADSGQQLTVVTSFYPMYIAASNVIGDTKGVILENLSEPKTGCLHDYQLTPADMKLLSGADVFIVNGGGIESFLSDVAESYPQLTIINASDGIPLIMEDDAHEEEYDHEDEHEAEEEHGHNHGEVNAHAWMSIETYMQQISNILTGMEKADTAHAKSYRANADNYQKELQPLMEEIDDLREQIAGNTVVSFHEAYAYLAAETGLDITYTLNLDEERQVSAGEVAEVVDALQQEKTPVVLAEETYGKDMGNVVSEEAGAKVIYLNPLVTGTYDKDSYLEGMQENIRLLKEAFVH